VLWQNKLACLYLTNYYIATIWKEKGFITFTLEVSVNNTFPWSISLRQNTLACLYLTNYYIATILKEKSFLTSTLEVSVNYTFPW
jgi:hypothetical protein